MLPCTLAPLYSSSKGKPGFIKHMLPTYDILNRIYLNTIAVKGGNFDAIYSYHIDLMYQSYLHKDSRQKMDVMNVLWNDIWLTLLARNSATYGPYLQLLINDAWKKQFNEDLMEEVDPCDITEHYHPRLTVKDHTKDDAVDAPEAPEVSADPVWDAAAAAAGYGVHDDDDDEFEAEPIVPTAEPSWLKKMMGKLRKSFCLKMHLQDRMYEEHVRAKEDRQRQKQFMRHFNLPVSDGSQDQITPKEEWVSGQRWSSSDDATPVEHGPSSSTTFPPVWAKAKPWGA